MLTDRKRTELVKARTAELIRRRERQLQSGDGGLLAFVRYFWDVLEPEAEFVDGWALEAMCRHLEAVTFGDIKRLLINVPPGFMKSLLTDVFSIAPALRCQISLPPVEPLAACRAAPPPALCQAMDC